ncbi:hypothetical protein CFIMG_006665RA [Ceratocystis fimbriata CBS 114723]|uniref:GDS1 winged helix domain-containing protein n=1 Tax=Ceratocystis fimbriata CBS 114723 TaxID=1035309 RepID=A0A2C5WWP5_9PEZI|nr:hypothetical protein CFIMG_006665RA [Ceratocystis fimbriata CBS 114723]
MPYNTRRKSLSLPSLGIHVPMTLAEKAAAASRTKSSLSAARLTSTSTPTPSSSSNRLRRSALLAHGEEPHAKRQKKFHKQLSRFDCTPPPSPRVEESTIESGAESDDSLNLPTLDDVDDEVVRASMKQLHASGNRPHLIKELATCLAQHLAILQQSTNPSAIVASRLSSFIKRSIWTPKSPCPIGKELESVHPRRTYFFLTGCPRQPLPEVTTSLDNSSVDARARSLLSPEDSSDLSASEEGDDDDLPSVKLYRARSPSPEVDLSSPEFDSADDLDNAENLGALSRPWLKCRRGRGPPPPLESDEHEFTQTATGLQKRKLNDPSLEVPSETESELAFVDDLPKYDLWANDTRPSVSTGSSLLSPNPKNQSPRASKKDNEGDHWVPLGVSIVSWDRIPETIDLDELDSLLESC